MIAQKPDSLEANGYQTNEGPERNLEIGNANGG